MSKKIPRQTIESIVGIINQKLGFDYLAAIIAQAVSSMRQEKPHSLSYQAVTLTKRVPETFVNVESKMEELALWLKSMETNGSSL